MGSSGGSSYKGASCSKTSNCSGIRILKHHICCTLPESGKFISGWDCLTAIIAVNLPMFCGGSVACRGSRRQSEQVMCLVILLCKC